MKEKYSKKGIENILYLDLETKMAPRGSAEWGMMYCFVARVRNIHSGKSKEYYDYAFPESKKDMSLEKIEPYKNDLGLAEQISWLMG